MNKPMTFLATIILLFLLNITLYSTNENYRFFVKKIKNPSGIVYPNEDIVTDEVTPIVIEPTQEEIDILANATTIETRQTPELNVKPGPEKIENKVVLGDKYQEILNIFSRYSLGKLELHSDLFDITDEYPDEYYEYYSKDLILYLFPTKTYSEVFDIFNVQKNLPIELNAKNNFGDNSFYINTLPEDTKNVRIVISYKSIVFGLKIKKDEYNEVKEILNNL